MEIILDLIHEGPMVYTLTWNRQPLLRFEDSGKSARLLGLEFPYFSWRDVLRWGTPYALAPLGHVVLHAAAVSREDGAVAFLGFGGAGKSTLARALGRRGWVRVADDMLVCDSAGRVNRLSEEVMWRWRESHAEQIAADTPLDYAALARQLAEPRHQDWVPLAALLFLDGPRSPGKEFVFRPLSAAECFRRLEQYGFGGLPSPCAWEHQFRVYGTAAQRVPCGILEVPDGLRRMRAALGQLEDGLRQWLCEPHAATR